MALFTAPPRLLTGLGCFGEVGTEVARWGRRCLIVTGGGAMRAQGILAKAEARLLSAGVEGVVFAGVESDPSVHTVDRAREAIRAGRCDVVLGLGGGSALDVAKAAAALAPEAEATRVFWDGLAIPGRGLPVLAAPSTFGTGSEATRVSVLSGPAEGGDLCKKSIRHDTMLPRVAIVDPLLGRDMPARLTAACGMDALTQAIESFLSRGATALSDACALEAVRLLADGLPRAVRDGADLGARAGCADGSLLAGIALHNARLGLVHGLAHPLGIRFGIAHGEICALLLPIVLRYNRAACEARYVRLQELLGADPAEFCARLLVDFGLPASLAPRRLDAAALPSFLEETLASGSTQANPRKVETADLHSVLREAGLTVG